MFSPLSFFSPAQMGPVFDVEGVPSGDQDFGVFRSALLEGRHDLFLVREIHDAPAQDRIIEATQLQEDALDPGEIVQAPPELLDQNQGMILALLGPESLRRPWPRSASR